MKTYVVKYTVTELQIEAVDYEKCEATYKWKAYKDAIQIYANTKLEAHKAAKQLLNGLEAKCKINKVERSAESLWTL